MLKSKPRRGGQRHRERSAAIYSLKYLELQANRLPYGEINKLASPR
ncbi:MAG: hypothetical protein LBU70_08690 [Chitinispirillales bacterium]|nr:hypothetical protein [Chitinispirillales bacterium]